MTTKSKMISEKSIVFLRIPVKTMLMTRESDNQIILNSYFTNIILETPWNIPIIKMNISLNNKIFQGSLFNCLFEA